MNDASNRYGWVSRLRVVAVVPALVVWAASGCGSAIDDSKTEDNAAKGTTSTVEGGVLESKRERRRPLEDIYSLPCSGSDGVRYVYDAKGLLLKEIRKRSDGGDEVSTWEYAGDLQGGEVEQMVPSTAVFSKSGSTREYTYRLGPGYVLTMVAGDASFVQRVIEFNSLGKPTLSLLKRPGTSDFDFVMSCVHEYGSPSALPMQGMNHGETRVSCSPSEKMRAQTPAATTLYEYDEAGRLSRKTLMLLALTGTPSDPLISGTTFDYSCRAVERRSLADVCKYLEERDPSVLSSDLPGCESELRDTKVRDPATFARCVSTAEDFTTMAALRGCLGISQDPQKPDKQAQVAAEREMEKASEHEPLGDMVHDEETEYVDEFGVDERDSDAGGVVAGDPPPKPTSQGSSWCLCYSRHSDAGDLPVTACRATEDQCLDLENRSRTGTRDIVANSLTKSCRIVSSSVPSEVLGRAEEWQASSKKGGWVMNSACLLD